MAKGKVNGLSIKTGPTQSGATATSMPHPVGGELLDINLISVLLSKYWPLLLIMLVPLTLVIYQKRSVLPKWFIRLLFLIKGL